MMHGHEQSDLGIAAVKAANKIRRQVAERVERRPRGDWEQDMCWTPSRIPHDPMRWTSAARTRGASWHDPGEEPGAGKPHAGICAES